RRNGDEDERQYGDIAQALEYEDERAQRRIVGRRRVLKDLDEERKRTSDEKGADQSADEDQSHRGVGPSKPRRTNPDNSQRGEPHDQEHQPEDSKNQTRLDETDRETADQVVG